MNITTEFNIGDAVTNVKDGQGTVGQIQVDVVPMAVGDPVTQIMYVVNFNGRDKRKLETDLDATDS